MMENKYLYYPFICVFYGTRFNNGHLCSYCRHPSKEGVCEYIINNKQCSYKMDFEGFFNDWVELFKHDTKKYLSYPFSCIFYGTEFKDCHPITYCGYPFKDSDECIYEQEKDCPYKMTGHELFEDWTRLKFLTEPMLYKGEK